MDKRTMIIHNVTYQLQEDFSFEQIQAISNALYMNLNDYEITERCTEVAVLDDSNDNFLRRFLATKRIEGKSENTIIRYRDMCYPMIHKINKPLQEVTTWDLRHYLFEYQETRGVSNRTLDGMRKCFCSFFKFLHNEGFIPTNPSAALSQIKYDKTLKKPYSPVDMEKLKISCKCIRDRALIEFLYSSGCRVSEVAALNRNDIDFNAKTAIVFGKGNKERIVYLNDIALYYLKEYINSRTDNEPCLFAHVHRPYNRLSKNGIESMLRTLGLKCGVENVHPHRYRRTLATNMIERGAGIQEVAIVLGHEDVHTTQIYCAISQQSVERTYKKLMC